MLQKNSFARRLRVLRESAGLSIPVLAARADMPRQTIHHLENGDRQPSLDTAKRLAKALRVSLAQFE